MTRSRTNLLTRVFAICMLLTLILTSCKGMPSLVWPEENATPNVVDVTVQNTLEANGSTVGKAFGAELNPKKWEYFAQFIQGYDEPEMHGVAMDKVDALYLGVQRDLDGNTKLTTGDNQVYAVMTGLYGVKDPTLNGCLIPFEVEGRTGIYLVLPNCSVTIPTASAYFLLEDWTGETKPRQGNPVLTTWFTTAEDSAPLAKIESALTKYSGTGELFAEMDRLANEYQDARHRYGWHAYVNATAFQTFVWVKLGEVSADWDLVDQAEGMGFYVANKTGWLEVYHPFAGINSDKPFAGEHHQADYRTQAPADRQAPALNNQGFIELVNTYRQSDELYLYMALLPGTVHPYQFDKIDVHWNNIIISRGDVSNVTKDSKVILPLDWTDTSDGFAGMSFVTTDGNALIETSYVEYTLTSALSPEEAFKWWGDK